MVDKGSKENSNKISNKKTSTNKTNVKKNSTNKTNSSRTKSTKTNSAQKSNKTSSSKTSNQTTNVKKQNNKIDKNVKSMKSTKSTKKIVILTTFIILTLAIIATSYFMLKTPKFNITSISVVGNIKSDINNIMVSSGINTGDNIFKSLFKIDKNSILNIPYISNVKISINLPSEFIIEVTERKSIYYAYDKEKNLYYRLDKEGVILEVCNNLSLKEDELLVNGITFDNEVKINTKINEIDYSKIVVYRTIEEQINSTFPDRNITKVNFENSLTKIYLNDKIEVILPNDTNLKYNLTFLKDIINNVGDAQGSIDMTKENPTFINF